LALVRFCRSEVLEKKSASMSSCSPIQQAHYCRYFPSCYFLRSCRFYLGSRWFTESGRRIVSP
jgi:hypothetical protein